MKITIRRSDFIRMAEHAISLQPEEVCGVIGGVDREDGIREIRKVYLLTNIDHTNEHFTIDPREQLASIKDMRTEGIIPLGNWHSHPETPSRPSAEDKRLANDSRASYLILSLAAKDPVLNAFHVEGPVEDRTARKEELILVEDGQSVEEAVRLYEQKKENAEHGEKCGDADSSGAGNETEDKEVDELTVTDTIDITDVTCPITFVKTKVALEELEDGDVLQVHINDGEPIQNVPRSVKEEGHLVLRIDDNGDGTFELFIKKIGD